LSIFIENSSEKQAHKPFKQTSANRWISEDISTVSKVERVLDFLRDGKWHTLKEVKKKLEVDEEGAGKVFEFLKEYSFIIIDEVKGKVKLEENVRKFLLKKAM